MMDIMLPWFPIVLSSAIGARLVGRSKAPWLGVTCALYFAVVVQMTTRVPVWADAAMLASVLAGAASIVGMAEWSGRGVPQNTTAISNRSPGSVPSDALASDVSEAIRRFDDWIEINRYVPDMWSSFDETIRDLLYRTCGATHMKPYRILSEGDAMIPLREIGEADAGDAISSRKGILGHVATTGRPFYIWDKPQGELVHALADQSAVTPAWCFPIRSGGHVIGVVSIGNIEQNNTNEPPSVAVLRMWELLVAQFWTTLVEVRRSCSAARMEPIGQLLTRQAFLDEVHRKCTESSRPSEPVAMCVLAVEGLRTLHDQGRWEAADDVVMEICDALRERVRPDDLLGRFDDSRILILLHRVDSELAALIAEQLTHRLANLPIFATLPDVSVEMRCGVAGSGTSVPDPERLLKTAIALCREARDLHTRIVTDVGSRSAEVTS